jgi:small nuclear ribonucleoprotein (snRNP)-like protein
MLTESVKRVAAVLLTALLPAASQAQAAPGTGVDQPAQQQASPPRSKLDPALRDRKVVVYLRDARAYKGKVIKVEADSLSLRVKETDPATGKKVKRTQRLAAAEIALIEPPRSGTLLWVALGLGAIPAREALNERRREKDQRLSAVLPPKKGQPFQVNPAVVGREVVVRLRSGQVVRGKLLEATPQEILLRVPVRSSGPGTPDFAAERLALREASEIDLVRQPPRTRGPWWLGHTIILGLFGVALAVVAAGTD